LRHRECRRDDVRGFGQCPKIVTLKCPATEQASVFAIAQRVIREAFG
jgi:hypothetical protein